MTTDTGKLVIFDFSRTLEGEDGIYDGMAEQICELREKGWTVAIASMAKEDEIRNVLKRTPAKPGESLKDQVDVIVGYNTLQIINTNGRADKTTRAVANHIIDATGAARSKTVVVGDAFTELLLAKNSKLKYLHAGWGDPQKEGLTAGLICDKLPYDETDVEMAESIPRIEQLVDRLEHKLECRKTHDAEMNCDAERSL